MDVFPFLLEFPHSSKRDGSGIYRFILVIFIFTSSFFYLFPPISVWLFFSVKYQLLTLLIINKRHWLWKTIQTDSFCALKAVRLCFCRNLYFPHLLPLFPSAEWFSIMAQRRWLNFFAVLLILVCSGCVHIPTNCPRDVRDMNRSWRKPQMACCFHTSIRAQYINGLNSNCKEVWRQELL